MRLMIIHNGMRRVIEEGERRGFTITNNKDNTRLFKAERNGEGFQFELLPGFYSTKNYLGQKYEGGRAWFASKPGCEQVLAEAGVPVPNAYGVFSEHMQIDDSSWTYPVVAKPIDGELSRNVFTHLADIHEVKKAVEIIWGTNQPALVEQHVDGLNYRLQFLGEKFLGAVQRRSPQVVGNGTSTVQALIDKRNQEKERGPIEDNYYTNHPIVLDDISHKLLAEQGYALDTVVPDGITVILHTKITAGVGSDYIDVVDNMHESYIEHGRNFMKQHELYLVGLDVITSDISKPPSSVGGVFNEHNVFPAVGLIENCNVGIQRPVSSVLWDYMLESDLISPKFDFF